jgi:hypothetical protein
VIRGSASTHFDRINPLYDLVLAKDQIDILKACYIRLTAITSIPQNFGLEYRSQCDSRNRLEITCLTCPPINPTKDTATSLESSLLDMIAISVDGYQVRVVYDCEELGQVAVCRYASDTVVQLLQVLKERSACHRCESNQVGDSMRPRGCMSPKGGRFLIKK